MTADLDHLAELALDLRAGWEHTTDPIWSKIDPELWALTHNPWAVLQAASRTRLETLQLDPQFRSQVDNLIAQQRQFLRSQAWFQQAHRNTPLAPIAYFSMEFGLSEALPQPISG